jgi:N-acetylglucosaminyldiphosphoundecaprenol N-acetyl-beta-D-mannosaminyltransferase
MYILNTKVDNLSKSEVLEKIRQLLVSNEFGKQLSTTNPEFILTAQKDEKFREIINNSWLSVADGYGIKLASKWLFKKDTEVIPGTDLVFDIAKICTEKNEKIFLLGGFGDTPKLTAEKLKQNSGLLVDYSVFENEQKNDKIKAFQPAVLFVAINHPHAQIWINENLPQLPSIKLAIGVGGAFDYISEKIKRAPESWRSKGLEWLYRLIHQPRRLKRIWNAWIVFSFKIFINSICQK